MECLTTYKDNEGYIGIAFEVTGYKEQRKHRNSAALYDASDNVILEVNELEINSQINNHGIYPKILF